MRSGAAARASRRAVGRSSGTSAITSSAPAPRSRATSRLAAGTGSSACAPTRAASAGSATPKIPTRTSPIVLSSDGDDGRRPGKVHRQPARRDLAMSRADVVLRQPGGERTQRLQRLSQELGAQLVGRLFLGARALGERQPAAVDQQRRSRRSRPRARARRSGRRPPADRWCSRTARASRGPRPCRRASDAARRGLGLG